MVSLIKEFSSSSGQQSRMNSFLSQVLFNLGRKRQIKCALFLYGHYFKTYQRTFSISDAHKHRQRASPKVQRITCLTQDSFSHICIHKTHSSIYSFTELTSTEHSYIPGPMLDTWGGEKKDMVCVFLKFPVQWGRQESSKQHGKYQTGIRSQGFTKKL